ncbi:MAG: hypothetical protein H6608_10045 [Flavobacteriales bacterium]|nr:hypothetical protein [Bacteroidota bacterium]MCB9241464.1 hypothetical protein [Flavobacteriales bacterium]
MGTSQQIIQKKISKRVRIGALILSPIILVGVASIIFQLSNGKDGEYTLFDFNLGKLWSWAVNGGSNTPSESEIRIAPVVPRSLESTTETTAQQPAVRDLFHTQPREARMSQQSELIVKDIVPQSFQPVEVEGVSPSAFYNSLKAWNVMDPAQKEFMISPGLDAKRSQFAVGISFAPSISHRHLRYSDLGRAARTVINGKSYTFGQSQDFRNTHDKPILNFYSGVDFYFHVSDKWTVQTGLYYTSMGERVQVIKLDDDQYSANQIATSESSAFAHCNALFDSPEMVEYNTDQKVPFNNYYGWIEVPVNVSYQVVELEEQMSLDVQAGLSYAYMDHADMLAYDYETNKYFWVNRSTFPLFNRHFITGAAGVAVSRYISDGIELFANPQFRYSFTSTFTDDYQIKQNQWTAGLRLGTKIHL